MMRKAALWLIKFYQKKGGGEHFFRVECNYDPSCSEYTKQAIEKYGLLRGVRLGVQRLRKCSDRDALGKTSDPLL